MLVEPVRLHELPLEAHADEVPPRFRLVVRVRLCRRRRERSREPPCGRGLYQHPFKDNVNCVSDPILAAVMRAPREPIELREYPHPDLPPGSALLRTALSEV